MGGEGTTQLLCLLREAEWARLSRKRRNGDIGGLGLVVYTFNLSPGEAEASRSLVNSRPGLHGKFQRYPEMYSETLHFKKSYYGVVEMAL